MLAGVEMAEAAPLVGQRASAQGRILHKSAVVLAGVAFACFALVVSGGVLHSVVLLSKDPRMGGVDGLGVLGARQRIEVPPSAQQLAVDPMADIRERAIG